MRFLMLPTVHVTSAPMPPISNQDKEALVFKVSSLCRKEHKDSYVEGWEYDLWDAVMGVKRIPSVDFGDMNNLLFYARSADVWVSHNGDRYYFVPMTSWLAMARDRKEKANG